MFCLVIIIIIIIITLQRFGPFSGHGLPDLLSPTFSLPCCCLPAQYLEYIYGIPTNSTLPSTPRFSHGPSSSETSYHYFFGDAKIIDSQYVTSDGNPTS
jgi:hypothetical protein